MFLKRLIPSALAAVCALTLLAPAAFAHGGCHGSSRQTQPVRCGVCTVEGCELAGRHTHDGATCCGYAHEDGFCDGACLALCTVKGCTLTGLHAHGGVSCCGNDHEAGFCGGGCSAAVVPASTGGHHGSHHGHH